jgi:hypothetical protein
MKIQILLLAAGIAMSFSCSGQKLKSCEKDYLEQELTERMKKEQDIRMEVMPMVAEYQKSGKGKMALIPKILKMNNIDEENQAWLTQMLENCAWSDELSDEANNAVFLILQHAEDTMQEQYFPLIEEKMEAGIISKSDWATMLDRIKMHNGEYQVYGTQTFANLEEENIVWPVEDPDNLEERRAEVGLPSMEAYFQLSLDTLGLEMKWDKSLTLEQAIEQKK